MCEKKCFKCGEVKPLTEFYKHPMMADGHVNKCKECNKKDCRESRSKRIEHYREYDRRRGNRNTQEDINEYWRKYPKKTKARALVARNIKKGNLFRMPCDVCGSTEHIHAHHDDYDKPLNVRWLCAAHHHQWHAKNGEGANAT